MDSSTIDIIISVITGVFTVLGAIIASTAGNKGLHDKIQNQMTRAKILITRISLQKKNHQNLIN